MSEHTPGPWYVDDLGANIRCNPDDDDFGTIVATMDSSRSPDETKANAALIAAAPDLLAALRHLTEVCVRNDDGSLTLGSEDVANLEREIAKAGGAK